MTVPTRLGPQALGLAGRLLCLLPACGLPLAQASAFCGFYVAQADAKLFNKASKVVLAWDNGRAAVTMASDYEGDPKEFALVVPVPTVVGRDDIRVVDPKLIDKLDAYSAPRLTEYFDRDPCEPPVVYRLNMAPGALPSPPVKSVAAETDRVKIEARYEVGVYDILILSAQDSGGLVHWLGQNGYKIPAGAEAVLGSYIKQSMHFFVAKVNLERQALDGGGFLKPLQVSYETRKFMLPIRLGTVNAQGPQDLIVFVLSRKGRVETSNYQTAKMDWDVPVPLFVKDRFGEVYKAAFDTRVRKDGMSKVYMEYVWDMQGYSPCDPCAAPVPTSVDLFMLGARWHYPDLLAADQKTIETTAFEPRDDDAVLTRLHVRYDAAHFPEDLVFAETADRTPFQAIYKLNHPAATVGSCAEAKPYLAGVKRRLAEETRNLADLTGWTPASVQSRMEASGERVPAVRR